MTPLLTVDGLRIELARGDQRLALVEDVAFELAPGGTLGIVGESGSGKTLTALSLMDLLPSALTVAAGTVRLRGQELTGAQRGQATAVRGRDIAMIFQDPMVRLSPVHSVGNQLVETLRRHRGIGRREALAEAQRLLARVGISDAAARLRLHAHELSGGMCQRVMIALAIAGNPSILVADEPTTALDVTVEAQILGELERLRQDTGMAIVLITHNFGIVHELCERVIVMYAGQMVESGPTDAVIGAPVHPYSAGLVAAIPSVRGPFRQVRGIPGTVPPPHEWGRGCRFASRCPHVLERCRAEAPPFEAHGARRVRCWRAGEFTAGGQPAGGQPVAVEWPVVAGAIADGGSPPP